MAYDYLPTSTLLSLEEWRREIGWHPWHFFQLTNPYAPLTSACNGLVFEYPWQGVDQAGRSDVRKAIMVAEERLRDYLHYDVAPRWRTVELPWPKDLRPDRTMGYEGADLRRLSFQLPDRYVIACGMEARTLIGTAALTYSDPDGDGLDELWTTSIATTVTDPNEIAVYFVTADRLWGDAVSEKYRIAPVTVTISAGTATIKGAGYIMVRPIKYEGASMNGLDPDTAGVQATSVEIYRRYNNQNGTTVETSQAMLIWETRPWPWQINGVNIGDPGDPAAYGYALARAGIRDHENGVVQLSEVTYDADTGDFTSVEWGQWRAPDRVRIRYYAGLPLDSEGRMQAQWRTTVARYAAAELERRICACDAANRELYRWQFDRSRAQGVNDEQYSLSAEDLNNPLGTKSGQIDAWRRVRNLTKPRGFIM